jgi:hypothetical protein
MEGTFRELFLGTFRGTLKEIQGTFREGAFREHSEKHSETFRNIQRTFREHSGCIQGT